MTRTDIHRPAAIRPEDYQFVAIHYIGCRDLGIEEVYSNVLARDRIAAHMETTGGRYSNHRHGGTCHVCGAHALYLAVFYHPATNSYIQTGSECCEKMEVGADFNSARRAVRDAKAAKAGKRKAAALLKELELTEVWELFQADSLKVEERVRLGITWIAKDGTQCRTNEYRILRDIVGKLIRYGNITDKQAAFLGRLVDQIKHKAERDRERAAERAAADDCPSGRMVVRGEVLKTDWRETPYGDSLKMLIKAPGGWLVWGTVPGRLDVERGDTVEFTATVEPSPNDPKFGFYKRPTKARIVEN